MKRITGKTLLTKDTTTEGAFGELLVVTNLMLLGYQVFRAVSPSSPYDLIALQNECLFKIEVTKGQRDKGKLRWPKHTKPYDVLAVWENDSSVTYFPSLT